MRKQVSNETMDKLVSLCKRRGLIFQSSDIYGGLSSTWDYGPLGVELKRHVKDLWWHDMITSREDVVGMDAAILMHPKVWSLRTRCQFSRSADRLQEMQGALPRRQGSGLFQVRQLRFQFPRQ